MSSTRRVLLAAALLAAAPAPALLAQTGQGQAPAHPQGHGQHHPGQHGEHGPGMRHRGPGNPVARLLEHREQLALTAQQVTRLQALQAGWDRQNAALVQQLQALHPQGERPQGPPSEAERAAMHQRMEQARPAMEQLHRNTRALMEQVHGVLTEQQRTQLHQFMRGPGGRGGEHGRSGHGGGHGGGHEGRGGQHGGTQKGGTR